MQKSFFLYIFLCLGVGGLGAFAVTSWLLPHVPTPPEQINVVVGTQQLHFASDLLLKPLANHTKPLASLDLRVSFPELGPAKPATIDGALPASVVLHIIPADPKLDPAERAAALYPRFLTSATRTDTHGLVVQDFEQDSTYAGEMLFVAPPEGRVFSARCLTPERGGRLVHTSCVFQFRSDKIDVDASFPQALLADWQSLALKLRAFVEELKD